MTCPSAASSGNLKMCVSMCAPVVCVRKLLAVGARGMLFFYKPSMADPGGKLKNQGLTKLVSVLCVRKRLAVGARGGGSTSPPWPTRAQTPTSDRRCEGGTLMNQGLTVPGGSHEISSSVD